MQISVMALTVRGVVIFLVAVHTVPRETLISQLLKIREWRYYNSLVVASAATPAVTLDWAAK